MMSLLLAYVLLIVTNLSHCFRLHSLARFIKSSNIKKERFYPKQFLSQSLFRLNKFGTGEDYEDEIYEKESDDEELPNESEEQSEKYDNFAHLLNSTDKVFELSRAEKRVLKSREYYKEYLKESDADWLRKAEQEQKEYQRKLLDYQVGIANGTYVFDKGTYYPDFFALEETSTELQFPTDYYQKRFLCVTTCPINRLGTRGQHFLAHLQWIRRTAFLRCTEVAQPACVSHEFVMLNPERIYPTAHLLFIKANNTEDVRKYLEVEPLATLGGVKPWTIYELGSHLDFDDENTAEYEDPHIFIGTLNKTAKHYPHATTILNDSITSFKKEETENSLWAYQNRTRMVYLGHLFQTNEGIEWSEENKTVDNAIGEIVLFNAYTNNDAKRFLQTNPLLKPAVSSITSNELGNPLDLSYMLAPVNVQDCSGLKAKVAFSLASKVTLDKMSFMDPQDLLRLVDCVSPNTTFREKLPDHFKENKRILKLLKDNKINYSFARYDPYCLGVEVDKTSLAYELSQITTLEQLHAFAKTRNLVEEDLVLPWTFKKYALDPPNAPLMQAEGLGAESWADVCNYPPYPKEKLEKIMAHEPYFIDSEEELTFPKLHPCQFPFLT